MQTEIAVFCGKGGTGKSTVSVALGIERAEKGEKVILISSHPIAELTLTVSLDGIRERFPRAAENLILLHLDAKEQLANLVRKTFPILSEQILASSLYQSLIDVAPGLKEFYFLARLQQIAERKEREDEETLYYDLLIWDAPATGHFVSTLRAARTFETYLTGPLATAGAEVSRFFSNPENIRVVPVATAEEMAVQETIDLCRRLEKECNLGVHSVLLNLASPMVGADEASMEALEGAAKGGGTALGFAARRGRLERERFDELRAGVQVPCHEIARVRHAGNDLDVLAALGPLVAGIVG
jgi:anion-transporting  ArsA/GET3 family ATPase